MFPWFTLYVLTVFVQVAAKDDNENLWFLARVEEHLASQDVFVVADEDNSEDKHRCTVPHPLLAGHGVQLPIF